MKDDKSGIFLGITTTETETGIAFCQTGKILYSKIEQTESYHNETVFIFLKDAFQSLSISPDRLKGIGVVTGPGKFTSLRIGLACVKGLAVVNKIPIKGFNTLDALVFSLPESITKQSTKLISALDVRRNEIYYRTYQGLQPVSDFFLSNPEQFALNISENALVFGSGIKRYLDIIKNNSDKTFSIYDIIHPDPIAVAINADRCISQNNTSELENLVPIYVR